MVKSIIFDFDGVIVESVDIKTRAFAELFAGHGKGVVDKVVEYHLQHTGVSRFDKFRYFYKEILCRELTQAEFQELCRRFEKLVMENVTKAPYVNGAKEFLDRYASRMKFFVVSATPQDEINAIIAKRGLDKTFAMVFGAPIKKPEATRQILRTFSLAAEETLYIGDALSDYRAAQENSLRFIARISGNESIFQDIDCLKINDLTALAGIVEKL